MDDALREVLEIGPEGHCPEVWAALKAARDTSRDDLVAAVRRAVEQT
jgi:hypothetical protein